ncbi:MAG: hypothetical protein ACFFB5_07145 [Promethearchaeota archaeon]
MIEQDDSEKWTLKFLKQWFSGLIRGLECHSEQVHNNISKHCGRACAHPQAVNFFREAWEKTKNIDRFIQLLNQKYQSGVFNKKSETSISVHYSKCYCPLWQLELVDSSIFRNCSSFWLREVFESALNIPVHVKTIQTICNGATKCLFEVEFPLGAIDTSLTEFQIYLKEAIKLRYQVDEGHFDV